MDFFILAMLAVFGIQLLKASYQRKRIALLGSHLGNYQIEKLMETLTDGYMRALGESDAARREQIWPLLEKTEMALCDQVKRLAADFSKVDALDSRVSTLPLTLPYADKLLPQATFDMRQALALHAQGVCNAASNSAGASAKQKAFRLSAELFLFQHTCHWFCKSKTVASGRMMVRHKTTYAQLLDSVAPDTRSAYGKLTGAQSPKPEA